ncbi:Uncharacterised protein [Mycobacteroides abscessus subsp. abscessus]|nr:Uncharacterised protein [Mycobacteroides abscessus subsp. abscessus]
MYSPAANGCFVLCKLETEQVSVFGDECAGGGTMLLGKLVAV